MSDQPLSEDANQAYVFAIQLHANCIFNANILIIKTTDSFVYFILKIRFRSYGTNAGGPANAGGAPSSSRKMQATKAQVDEVRKSMSHRLWLKDYDPWSI